MMSRERNVAWVWNSYVIDRLIWITSLLTAISYSHFLSVVKQSNFKKNSGAHINEDTDRCRKLTLLFGFVVIIVQTRWLFTLMNLQRQRANLKTIYHKLLQRQKSQETHFIMQIINKFRISVRPLRKLYSYGVICGVTIVGRNLLQDTQ